MSKIAISVKNLTIQLGEYTILEDINFDIDQGDLVYILGPNGSGKTTLIKTIIGIHKQKKGQVKIFGKERTQQLVSNNLGYIPQYTKIDRDFPITVKEMIKLECDNANACPYGVTGHLKFFNSKHLKNRKISNLSGGEFQKILIARALVTDPKILILDEPFNNLDQNAQCELVQILKDLNNDQSKTIIIITHDHTSIDMKSDKIIYLKDKKAHIGKIDEIVDKYIHVHDPIKSKFN